MKKILISAMRDRNASLEHYRQAAYQLGLVLAMESEARIPKTKWMINTPLALAKGERFQSQVILVPILRSGLVLLPPFLKFFPESPIGFIGMRRDEQTAQPMLYYSNLPTITSESLIFLLDPMIATGGSASLGVNILKKAGALESNISLISFIASPEGIAHFNAECPEAGLNVAEIDEGLDPKKFIVPGLGDFGDRYFGTLKLVEET